MSGRHSGIAILAAVTALLVASCTIAPTAERSASPVSTESIRPATASDRADAPSPTATAASATPAATPSASPPAPEPSPLATDPVPATTALPPLVPGPLRDDGLARVVVDRLRIRSAPDVSASSERLEPLLDSGTMLFVLDGPVEGSGYDWYQVAPLDGGPLYEFIKYRDEFKHRGSVTGWVARAARDGTPWIIGLDPECPDPGAFYEDLGPLERLNSLVALSCYGKTTLQFRAQEADRSWAEGSGPEEYSPEWLIFADDTWGPPAFFDVSSERHGSFDTAFDPARFPDGGPSIPSGSIWDLTGHFDDPAARTCRIDFDPEIYGQDYGAHRDPNPIILSCRTTFIVTELHQFTGIDPG